MKLINIIEKSDRYVFLAYWLFAMPLLLPTFMQNDYSMLHHIVSYLLYVVNVSAIVIFIVYYLFRVLLSKGKYFIMIVLLILGVGVHTILLDMTFSLMDLKNPFTSMSRIFEFKFLFRIINNARNIGMLTTLLIAINFYRMQKKVLTLEKERKENELRWLKSQIDPHFLFNNLNILSILIQKDQQKASTYVEKLASLYRYLVRQKDQDIVSFHEEWIFAQNYIYLIEQRFGGAYQFIANIDFEHVKDSLIPPASIQMLFENIIKHNEGDVEHPLKIYITVVHNKLIVKNDLRLKQKKMDSTGTGLQNLKNRIRLLTNEELMVFQNEQFFEISLPLVLQVVK